jgi:hypothetical protein
MRNKIAGYLQLVGLILLVIGTVTSKNSNVLTFIVACLTGVKPE